MIAASINRNSGMVPKVLRCTVDILNEILYDKTVDCGKKYELPYQPYLVKIPTGY
jgi:hypothetical protein